MQSQKEQDLADAGLSVADNPASMTVGEDSPSANLYADKKYKYSQYDARHKPLKTIDNLATFLASHPNTKDVIRYNLFADRIEVNGEVMQEHQLLDITRLIERVGSFGTVSKNSVYDAVRLYSNDKAYDPIIDKLEALALSWDNTPRLSTWLADVLKQPQSNYLSIVGESLIRHAIRRQIRPGSEAPFCWTFVGDQGFGKTMLLPTLFKPLAPSTSLHGEELIAIISGDLGKADSLMKTSGKLVALFDEGSAIRKADSDKAKTFISANEDQYRMPYDRLDRTVKRRFVVAMTENRYDFLTDTENRRYYPIEFRELYDFSLLEQINGQLLAEAYIIEKTDTPPQIPKVQGEELNNIQDEYKEEGAWHDTIEKYLRTQPSYLQGDTNFSVTLLEVWQGCIASKEDKENILRFNNTDAREIGKELKRMGLERKTIRRDNKTAKGYKLKLATAEKLKAEYVEYSPAEQLKMLEGVVNGVDDF